VDIGSIEFIHKQILKFRDEGNTVILVSSELSEIMSLSDRVIVMYKGKNFWRSLSKRSINSSNWASYGGNFQVRRGER